MASTAQTSRAQHSYAPTRHHPYAQPAARAGPSWSTGKEQKPRAAEERREVREPPSPPSSRREQSETPSLGLGVAFGGSAGGKWWDEELPAPPSSLTSILDSFRKSGEGDRELLLSILGAKKAEEERLTALIQTRLTILQARLSLHSTAASLAAPSPVARPEGPMALMPERTPSLGASSRGSSSSSAGPASPLDVPLRSLPAQLASEKSDKAYFNLPPPSSMLRRRSRSPSPIDRRARPYNLPAEYARRSLSPKTSHHSAPGLDMLLDAGMESERRDSNERR